MHEVMRKSRRVSAGGDRIFASDEISVLVMDGTHTRILDDPVQAGGDADALDIIRQQAV